MDVRLPNGTIIKNVPDGTPKEVVMKQAIEKGLAKPSDFGMTEPQKVAASADIPLFDNTGNPIEADMPQQERRSKSFSPSNILGPAEAIATAGTGAASSLQGIVTGIYDSVKAGKIGTEEGAKMVEDAMARYAQAGTYQPRTQAGQDITAWLGENLGALPPTLAGFTPTQSVGAMQAAGRTAQALGAERLAARAPAPVKGAELAQQFAEENNATLMTSDVVPTTSAAGRAARTVSQETPLFGTSSLRERQQKGRVGFLERLREETPEITDEALSKSLIESNDKYSQAVAKRYQDISGRMQGRQVPINRTIQAIDNELFELSREGVVKDNPTIETLFKLRDDLTSGAQDFQTLRDNRTYIREQLKADPSKPSKQADRVIDRVYAAMTEDIQDAVQKNLGNEARFKLDQVDKIYALEAKTQKKTKLRNALVNGDVKPEEATKVLFSNSPTDVRELYKTLDDQGRANARAAIINKVLESAGDSPEKFLSAIKRYKTQYGTFFKGEEKYKLDGLIAYLDATRRASTANVEVPTGKSTIPFLLVGGFASDIASGGGALTATVGTISALSRIYESAPVRRALMRMSKAKKGTPNYDAALIGVDSAVRSQIEQVEKDKDKRK